MSFEPDNYQRLLLLRLAFTDEGGEFLKDLDIKTMVAPRRKALQREGLTEESTRKPADGKRPVTYISLTEKGWAWCNANLSDFCGDLKRPIKIMLPLLSAMTRSMADYFQRPEAPASLGEFIQQCLEARPAVSQPTTVDSLAPPTAAMEVEAARQALPTTTEVTQPAFSGTAVEPAVDLPQAIRSACLDLADGRVNVRVRLSDLRRRLTGAAKTDVDTTLLAMETRGELSLYRLDNPQEIGPDDREAALSTPTGAERHILYFGGAST